MPTPEYFARYPPFPSDVPVADLTHLSLRKLLENDKVESEKLFEAGKTDGLFLLDLKGCDIWEVMIKHTENAFVLNEKLFALGQEELRKHPVTMPTNRFGYKLDSEFVKQVDEPDAIDIYTLSQDHVLGLTPSRSNPELVDIINFGDAIVQWTGGLLRANMHHVTTPPGEQATCTRFSVGYSVRPAADASMQRLRSSVIPPLMEGEEPETRCPREWDSSKAKNVVSKKVQRTKTETSLSTSTTEIFVLAIAISTFT